MSVDLDKQKVDYLDEHLPYMMKMLRYTSGQLSQGQHYLSWNAHFESFAVHARNLVNFLNNADGQNFKACDFAKDFRARPGEIAGHLQKLRDQVFHLGKNRPRTVIGKFDSEDAGKVFDWIVENFAEFLAKLPKESRDLYNDAKADPAKDQAVYLTVTVDGTACTASMSVFSPFHAS